MVRQLNVSDIPGALCLNRAAGWNQTAGDWRNLLCLAPDGCFGIECDGKLVATTTAVSYGRELAWIGMVVTDPAYRRRGLARHLMEHALQYLDQRGVEWIKLDATEMGRPLYLSLGFTDESVIERWVRPPQKTDPRSMPPFQLNAALDRAAFGADREHLLESLAQIEAASAAHGYAMGRHGAHAAYFGPCVSADPGEARELARWFAARHANESIYWDLLPHNREAARMAFELAFAPQRQLTRMARKGSSARAPFMHNDQYVFAIAGFEYG